MKRFTIACFGFLVLGKNLAELAQAWILCRRLVQ